MSIISCSVARISRAVSCYIPLYTMERHHTRFRSRRTTTEAHVKNLLLSKPNRNPGYSGIVLKQPRINVGINPIPKIDLYGSASSHRRMTDNDG
jgi:hypothetical protein